MAPQGPSAGPPPNLPLNSRQKDVLISAPLLTTFATIFVLLRLGVNWRNKKYWLLTDYLLIVGTVLNVTAIVFCIRQTKAGGGKHVWDPSIDFVGYMKNLWFSQLLNIYAMAFVKGSVCAYLFMLDFSKRFRIMVWISLVIHVATNFVFPSIVLFGECRPISKHWHAEHPGSCWGSKPRTTSGYVGAASNIATDLFYTSAPLVYLRNVQLPTRTIWGVRAVFLVALFTTVISALKLYEIRALNYSNDPSYTSVNLTIYSITEVATGTFAACLPPLRKTFESGLRKILPESIMGSSKNPGNSYALPAYGSQLSRTANKPPHESDDESERAILPEGAKEKDSMGGIVRTTHVSISDAPGPRGDHFV